MEMTNACHGLSKTTGNGDGVAGSDDVSPGKSLTLPKCLSNQADATRSLGLFASHGNLQSHVVMEQD